MLRSFLNDIDVNIKYLHIKRKLPYVDFHLHDGCEIYFLISGDVNYFVEKNVYTIKPGDIIITNNHEIHKPVFTSNAIYERITIEFNPALPELFNYSNFNLLNCFYNRKNGEQNTLLLNSKEVSDVMDMFQKYEKLSTNEEEGSKILKLNCFIELLIYINKLFKSPSNIDINAYAPKKLLPILDYIDKNLDGDLSLEAIEKKFYINRFYLSRLFKKLTGNTIHEYIIYKRLSMAKKLLSEGYNVTEACMKSGFNDYSNFSRMFKKTVGIQPSKYTKLYNTK